MHERKYSQRDSLSSYPHDDAIFTIKIMQTLVAHPRGFPIRQIARSQEVSTLFQPRLVITPKQFGLEKFSLRWIFDTRHPRFQRGPAAVQESKDKQDCIVE